MEKDAQMEEHVQTLLAIFFEPEKVFKVKVKEVHTYEKDEGHDELYDIMEAKYLFSKRAKEADSQLRQCINKDNTKITNKILVELYVSTSLLNKKYTLNLERIKFYTQKINDLSLENIDYEKWHSTVLDMETECARTLSDNLLGAQELIQDLKIKIGKATDEYNRAVQALENAKDLKYAGLWSIIGGALGGLVIMGLSALTGNVVGVGIGLTVFVGSIAVGGGIAIKGMYDEAQAKAILDERRKQLEYLKGLLNSNIEEKTADIIKTEEKAARKALGIEDK